MVQTSSDSRDFPVASQGDRCPGLHRSVQIFPVVKQRRLPMVFQTMKPPQFLAGKVIDVPVVQVEQVPHVPSWR